MGNSEFRMVRGVGVEGEHPHPSLPSSKGEWIFSVG